MQVRFTYNLSLLRNDASLFKYGFVQQQDPPRLCAVDLPGGYLGGILEGPPWEYYAGGRLATRAEQLRLSAILAKFPTAAEEDELILQSAPHSQLSPINLFACLAPQLINRPCEILSLLAYIRAQTS